MDLWQSVLANAPGQVERLVTQGGVPVDERNDLGETALHLACSNGLDNVAAVLLAHGADLAIQDWESGWTPLHRSVYHAHLSTSLLLLRHARQAHGRQFMKTLLYDTKDFAHQSAMQLVSSYYDKTKPSFQEIYHYGTIENSEKPTSDDETEEKEAAQDLWGEAPQRPQRGGMVYTFGKVDFQLGYHLPHVNVQSSPRLVELPITSTVVQISASKFHTIALNAQGQVYVWGFGKGGRLGTGTEFDHVEPTRLTSLNEIPMVQVAAGENHTLALSRTGQVFSWGSNSYGQLGHNVKTATQESRLIPKRIDTFKGMVMTAISASGVHSGAICGDDGCVYTWGSNKRGQLGRKEGFGIDQPNPTPKRVDRLVPGHALSVIYEPHDSLRAVHLAMSDVHTCVILRSSKNGQSHGQVWQCGYGSNVPTRILFKEKRRTTSHLLMNEAWLPRWKLRSDDIVAVACAHHHSIALSACGSVYTWGHNGDALSHQKTDYIPPGTPQRVRLDQYGPIVHICASQDHCAVVSQSGDLVSWGCGPQGVLGHGAGNSWQPSPKQVHGAKKVVAVAAGHQHTVLLVAPRLPSPPIVTREVSSPPKLRCLLEMKIAEFLDLSNVATVWKYASVYSQCALEQYCVEYMRLNWDALLEMGSKDRLDSLFDLMLAPSPKTISRRVALAVIEEKPSKAKSASDRKAERKASVSLDDGCKTPNSEASTATVAAPPVPLVLPSPVLKPQCVPATARRVKGAKFVSVDSFFSEKDETKAPIPQTTEPRSLTSPWNVVRPSAAPLQSTPPVLPTFPTLGDSLVRLPRKESVDRTPLSSSMPRKSPMLGASPSPSPSPKLSIGPSPVLCYDGSERAPVSAFSLDAFIKKSTRKKSRSDSIELSKATPTWGMAVPASQESPAATRAPLKSLKEIQDEEQARVRAEAAAKEKNGGFLRKASSINSWGLVQQQSHISFEELQQREEEERMIEEQRQILAQIERENRQREADEKRRLAKQEAARQRQQRTTPPPSQIKSERNKNQQGKKTENKKRENKKPENKRSENQNVDPNRTSARRTKAEHEPEHGQKPAKRATENAASASGVVVDNEAKPQAKPKPKRKPTKAKPRHESATSMG